MDYSRKPTLTARRYRAWRAVWRIADTHRRWLPCGLLDWLSVKERVSRFAALHEAARR
jgi:hypothetical protein